MSSRTQIHVLLALFIHLVLQPSLVLSATIPQSLSIKTTNATVNEDTVECMDNEGWVGEGIVVNDCIEGIREFYRTEVQPRGGQQYEFVQVGDVKTTNLPRINSPRRFHYGKQRICITGSTFVQLTSITIGTCVVDIGMLYIYWPGPITEIKPLYEHTDIAVFNQIVNAVISVVSKCVEGRQPPVAGWTSTGMLAQCSPQDCFSAASYLCLNSFDILWITEKVLMRSV